MSHGKTQVSGIIDPPRQGVAQGMLKIMKLFWLNPQNMRNQCKQLKWKLYNHHRPPTGGSP